MDASQHQPAEILSIWFGDHPDDAIVASRQASLWWGKDARQDADIASRFGATVEAALAGELDQWAEDALGRLALIIVLDQFTRTLFRDQARAFAGDAQALSLCEQGIELGHDQQLRPVQRLFFYLPMEHAESLPRQQRCEALLLALVEAVPEDWRSCFAGFADYARQHREVIETYGRFPHRNQALGRRSSEQERAYLDQPGSGF